MPALLDGPLVIWDSLAIMEYLFERDSRLYPTDPALRALARSMSAEMHSGFGKLREVLNFHAKKHFPGFDTSAAQADIDRVLTFGKRL